MRPRDLRNAALECADRGWYVIPLRASSKIPITSNGLKDATDDLVEVLRWWQPNGTPYPHNVGVVCHPSGLVVLDVDPRHGGDDSLHEAERRLGQLPPTVSAVTGGEGQHLYFRHPGGTLRGQLAPGLDVKDHGYVLVAPSRHPSGRRYEWDDHPDEVEVASLPARWVDALQVVERKLERNPYAPPDPLREIPASVYVPRLTGREPDARGWMQCPFHKGGQERTPSFKIDDNVWACYACAPPPGMRCQGGNIYALAGMLWGHALPLRGGEYLEVKARLREIFGV